MNVKLDLINLKMSYFQCFDLIKGHNKAETAHRRSNEAEILAELCSKSHKHQRTTLYHNLIKKLFLTELINTLSCTGQNWGGLWFIRAVENRHDDVFSRDDGHSAKAPNAGDSSSAVLARDPVLTSITLGGSFTILKPNVVKTRDCIQSIILFKKNIEGETCSGLI